MGNRVASLLIGGAELTRSFLRRVHRLGITETIRAQNDLDAAQRHYATSFIVDSACRALRLAHAFVTPLHGLFPDTPEIPTVLGGLANFPLCLFAVDLAKICLSKCFFLFR